MNLKEAFDHFVISETFKKLAKDKTNIGGKLRSYKARYAKGQIKDSAIIKLLKDHGYKVESTITVTPPE